MKLQPFFGLLLASVVSTGCNQEQPRPDSGPKDGKGININVPGVDIKIQKDKGVDVKTPDTEVKVKP